MSYKRTSVKRLQRHALQSESVEETIGEIFKGCEIFCLNKGQFSKINVIEHLLKQTGAADVTISTWTAAHVELDLAKEFLLSDKINNLRFLVDRSFPTRQPEYFKLLLESFGEDSIRVARSHSKFVLIRNKEWNLCVRTSANLNENKRLESFEISDDKALCDFLENIVNELYNEKFSTKCLADNINDNTKQKVATRSKKDDGAVFAGVEFSQPML